jgi:hypothetical protein
MVRLAFVPFALLCAGAVVPEANQPPPSMPSLDRMNVMPERPGCVPIARQVAGEDRRYNGTRLDRQPPGRLILAVQRQVGGCPEVTFVNAQRR